MVWAFWAWLAASALVGIIAVLSGGSLNFVAGATALAISPAVAGFILIQRAAHGAAAFTLIAAWLVMATALVAGTGGAFSPLAASLLIAPALAALLWRDWVVEAAASAVICYAIGAVLAAWLGGVYQLGPFADLLTAASLVFVGGLAALSFQPRAALEETLSRRVAEVSHDLRTPLNHIIGFAEMLEKEILGPIGPRNVEYAALIRQAGGHLLELVNDLLDLSKVEAGRYDIERETFDARTIVEEVVRLSALAAEKKRIALSADLPAAALMVSADPRVLRRMLINTVGNALKFTPEDGRVTVAARGSAGALILDTIDSGPGIPEEERLRLGNAYEQGEYGARAEGTGLGLALVRGLAALHDGTLSFHDAPGGGALVRVEMPVLV